MGCEHRQPELQRPGAISRRHVKGKLCLELRQEHCCDFAASREEGWLCRQTRVSPLPFTEI